MSHALSGYTVIVSQPSPATFEFMALNDDDATQTAAAVIKIAIDELSLDSSVVSLGPEQRPIGSTRSVEHFARITPRKPRRPL